MVIAPIFKRFLRLLAHNLYWTSLPIFNNILVFITVKKIPLKNFFWSIFPISSYLITMEMRITSQHHAPKILSDLVLYPFLWVKKLEFLLSFPLRIYFSFCQCFLLLFISVHFHSLTCKCEAMWSTSRGSQYY